MVHFHSSAMSWLSLLIVVLTTSSALSRDESFEEEYTWQTGPWGDCYTVSGCGKGFRRRSLWCATTDGRAVLQFLCSPREAPVSRQDCYRACNRHFVPVDELLLKVGEWGTCVSGQEEIPDPGTPQMVLRPLVGMQTRNVSCQDKHGNILDLSLCVRKASHPLETTRSCIVGRDCAVGNWSPWITRQEGCASSTGQVIPEARHRRRRVVQFPLGEGKPCPHLVEDTEKSRLLPTCDEKFQWVPTPWSPCLITSPRAAQGKEVTCGGGVQLRNLSCATVENGAIVGSNMCDLITPMPTVQRCEMACPRDCQVSEWGIWGVCRPLECQEGRERLPEGYRIRSRRIVTSPSPSGISCPALQEVQQCSEDSCYRWIEGPWSGCTMALGSNNDTIVTSPKCGDGMKSREVWCVSLTGLRVDTVHCESTSPKPSTRSSCRLPCPFDCAVSEWSSWSPCSHACADDSQAALRHRNRSVLAPPGQGGHSCPDPDQLIDVEPCNTHGCQGFRWTVLPWQECKIKEGNPLKPTCGTGRRHREVWCVDNAYEKVPDWRCLPAERPNGWQHCTVSCVIDCLVSKWSTWTPCPDPCDHGEDVIPSLGPTEQQRKRQLITPPENHGAPCLPLAEERACPILPPDGCPRVQWSFGRWSDCHLAEGQYCGRGFRTRVLECTADGRLMPLTQCLEINGTSLPQVTAECQLDCETHCVVSQWSEWTQCPAGCPGHRERFRDVLGPSMFRPECQSVELKQYITCPCVLTSSTAEGNWTSCILEEDDVRGIWANGRFLPAMCGVGKRFRRFGCYNGHGELVHPRQCLLEDGIEEEPCMEPCPSDCQLTEWTPWGPCSTVCGLGTRNRTRSLIYPSIQGGRPCEPTIEIQICGEPCLEFQWLSGAWSECIVPNASCGWGHRVRRLSCIRGPDGSIPGLQELCDPLVRPVPSESCYIPCPGHCAVSEWSNWSPCDLPCGIKSQRHRTRAVLRPPTNSFASCPPLSQAQACLPNVTCFHYHWHISEWSSCLPLGGSPCGEGMRHRKAACFRSDGRPTDDSFCISETKPLPLEAWCAVDCPVDCEVSAWSRWEYSNCSCGKRDDTLTIHRFILTNPSTLGRPCPRLIETRPCPLRPCFLWQSDPWGPCDLQGATCGYGSTKRNVTCVSDAGNISDEEKCLEKGQNLYDTEVSRILDSHREREDTCYIPCEDDCQVTEWSTWTACLGNCEDEAYRDGVRTRYRTVTRLPREGGVECPRNLQESRLCRLNRVTDCGHTTERVAPTTGDFLHFPNCTSNSSKSCRDSSISCTSSCSAENSVCSSEGICVCKKGFIPRFQVDKPKSTFSNHSEVKVGVPNSSVSPWVLVACDPIMKVEGPFFNASFIKAAVAESRIQYKYYPEEDVSFWMFAMIGVGSIFIVFVAVTIYLMWPRFHTDKHITG